MSTTNALDVIANNFFNKTMYKMLKISVASMLLTTSALSVAGKDGPILDNTAYVLMDYNTGTILASKNPDKSLPPASLTKMMTSYIIEEGLTDGSIQETDQVMMSENAWCRGSSEQSCMYVPVHKNAKMIDMLRGIIIQSGNDASVAVAEHLAGSEESFAEMMNDKAKEIGMKNTHFKNATGMPAEGHKASAKDLALLAKAIIDHGGKYYGIYAEKEFTYNKITQPNRNALLMTDKSVDGLKTGHTNAAGFCLVASSKRKDMRLISVIMGTKSSKERASQSRKLLNWGFGSFTTVVQSPKGQFVSKEPIWFGKKSEVEVATGQALQVLVRKTQKKDITTRVKLDDGLEAPIEQGQKLGKVQALVDGQVVASVDAVATHSVKKAGILTRTWQRIKRAITSLF